MISTVANKRGAIYILCLEHIVSRKQANKIALHYSRKLLEYPLIFTAHFRQYYCEAMSCYPYSISLYLVGAL